MMKTMLTDKDIAYLQQAVDLALVGVKQGMGGPFGCIIVKDDRVIGKGYNQVISDNDPTAHAEVVAIRDACTHLGSYQLTGCTLYTSCEPCPMCLGAIYWARPERILYATTRFTAADAGFDDKFIYDEIAIPDNDRKIPFVFYHEEQFLKPFQYWKEQQDKRLY
ncbi:guanine deaminase [Olivibacter ginsenosidimutans]|uniref:Guanine deaminase n=1 Tax=Olivibacter ginsenosidimutans TaxID=1176537 RepID=A0ABP9C947_9SPHI